MCSTVLYSSKCSVCTCSYTYIRCAVEDPSENYQRMRDTLDCRNAVRECSLFAIAALPARFTVEMAAQAAQTLKLVKVRHCPSLLLLYFCLHYYTPTAYQIKRTATCTSLVEKDLQYLTYIQVVELLVYQIVLLTSDLYLLFCTTLYCAVLCVFVFEYSTVIFIFTVPPPPSPCCIELYTYMCNRRSNHYLDSFFKYLPSYIFYRIIWNNKILKKFITWKILCVIQAGCILL